MLLVHQFGLPTISGLTITLAELVRLIPEVDVDSSASFVTYADGDTADLIATLNRDHRGATCVVGLNLHIDVGWEHTLALAGWSQKNGIPLVVYAHDYWPHHRDGVATLMEKFDVRLVAITPAIIADLAADGFEAALLPAGISVSDEPRPPTPLPVGPRTVGVVGRLVPRKRFTDVVAAYCQVTVDIDAALCLRTPPSLVYTPAQDEERLAEIRRTMASSPRAGTITIDARPRLGVDYTRWAIYVSASEYEGVSMTPLEALLQGCPVILSDIPPHRHIVDAVFPRRRDELLFPVGDRSVLAKLLRHELLTSERRTETEERARKIHAIIKERWSLNTTAHQLLSLAQGLQGEEVAHP